MTSKKLKQKTLELEERVKELRCIAEISKIVDECNDFIPDILSKTVIEIPKAFLIPEEICCCIDYDSTFFKSNCDFINPNDCIYKKNHNIIMKLNEKIVFKTQLKNTSKFSSEKFILIEVIAERLSTAIERINIKENLITSEKFFTQMFIQNRTSTQLFDSNGSCIRVNPKFCDLFGVKEKDIVNKYNIFKDQAAIDTGILPLFKQIFTNKKSNKWRINFDIEKASLSTNTPTIRKEKIWLDVLGYPILDTDGNLQYVVLQHYDVTDHIESYKVKEDLQKQLLLVQKLESIGVLAGGIAHDFNNLLGAIMGNVSMAQKNDNEFDREEYLNKAIQAIKRASDLTHQLLTFAKTKTKGGILSTEITSISKIIKESVNLSLGKSSLSKCNLSLPEDLWKVKIDEGQIGQVIRNLIINASQAMPGGGIIQIQAENINLLSNNSFGVEAGDFIHITISDLGTGIPEKYINKIFDPYFTTKDNSGGSGLGLSVAFSIIYNHHGHIGVDSKPGVGTTFHIYIPAINKKTPTIETNTNIDSNQISSLKILVMDDDETIRNVIESMLISLEHQVTITKDGLETIKEYSNVLKSEPFDLVILDLTIPGGMGGIETLEKLREINPDVDIVISSGYGDQYPDNSCGFLSKPYQIDDLKKVILEIQLKTKTKTWCKS